MALGFLAKRGYAVIGAVAGVKSVALTPKGVRTVYGSGALGGPRAVPRRMARLGRQARDAAVLPDGVTSRRLSRRKLNVRTIWTALCNGWATCRR
jgi:hypothetical protein